MRYHSGWRATSPSDKSPDIKKCPRCFSLKVELQVNRGDWGYSSDIWRVCCSECGIAGGKHWSGDWNNPSGEAPAIERWNLRGKAARA